MSDKVDTIIAAQVREIPESGVANLDVIHGGRQPSVFEKAIDVLVRRPDASLDQLQQMMQMHERWTENQARMAFVEAMARFKSNPPEILKTKLVDFASKGGRTTYLHEELGVICELIVKGLAEVGISHRWKPHNTDGKIGVSCVLTHRDGHEQDDGALWAGYDTSGGKNTIQAMASAAKYLQRYTLLMAVGLAPKGLDEDDGAGAEETLLPWAKEIVQTMEKADTFEQLQEIRKAAAARCRKEDAKREWNDLINPAYARIGQKQGWIEQEKPQ